MKILKKIDVSGWSYKTICSLCESELEVESKDLCCSFTENKSGNPTYGDGTYDFIAHCVVCCKALNIPVEKIPKILQHEIKLKFQRNNSNYFDK